MTSVELSRRLSAVAALVTPGRPLADIGTDHAYLPISLVQRGITPGALAADVNEGPLQRARDHIRELGLEDQIGTRRMDGISGLKPGEAESIVIAGMGGGLTVRILEDGREELEGVKELILQPQSELFRVRRWLETSGFRIEAEDMVLEDGKYYPMMRAVPGTMVLAGETEARYGPCLLKERHPVLKSYLNYEEGIKRQVLAQLECAVGPKARERRGQILEDLEMNRQAQSCY